MIFEYTDNEGDTLWVRPAAGDQLEIGVRGEFTFADVNRDAVLRLHAALGEWLYPVHTPEWANKSLIDQLIQKAVADQVAAVLPLHLKPGDRLLVDDGDGRVWPDPEPHDVGHAEEPVAPYTPPVHMTTEDKCQVHACGSRHLVTEPETDHGRLMSELPRRTRPRPVCVSCGHGWGEHTGGICWGEHAGNHCTCTRERPGTAGTA